MFPIRDNRGRVIAFGGRVLGDDKPKYLNSPETPVFHKGRELYGLWEARQANSKLARVVIVEGYMDVIALAQFGITYAVATLGTATSQEHVEKLFRHTEELVFCFDGDEAGRRAAWRALDNTLPCLKDGRQVKFLLLPEGEDPDTLVRKDGTTYFEGLLDEATPLSEFFFEHMGAEVNTNTMDGRARLASLAKPYLEKLPQGVFRELMRQRLGEITQLRDIPLNDAPTAPINTIPETAPPSYEIEAPQPRQRQPLRRENKGREPRPELSLVDAIIRMLLNAPQEAANQSLPEGVDQLDLPHVGLLIKLFHHLQTRPDASTAAILGHWQNDEDGDLIFSLAAREFLLPHQDQTPELADALRRLRLRKVEQDLEQIISEGVKDKDRLKELLHLKKELSRQ